MLMVFSQGASDIARSARFLYIPLYITAHAIVTILTFIGITYSRTLHAVYFGAGSILSAITAKMLKRVLRQPRPVPVKRDPAIRIKQSYGMPSSHSLVMAYFAAYLSIAWLVSGGLALFWLAVVTDTAALAVMWSRIRLGHHSLAQVAVGFAIGALLALSWHQLWVLKGPQWRAMLFQDDTAEDDVLYLFMNMFK
ncbi:phosphatidic acid phosphatase type 2/haloperoxidase [Syncephalastrum racemosum]|uniref:Phosphatidic acid phosphatase type 2/haloperoxidase n=1 Tax=Syncephalastrum racemosum TaxID=13706 RepID=A0A1X2HVR7_SYNRA|nr:phosphatidic acid phosphatase type 2/haloperoxidase [Syncephalastrum racemosum]